jgi:Arm DNA-binding domain
MKAKLTDIAIRSYQPRAAQYSIGDAACPGLCIRITPKGVKSFAYAYRNKATGKVQWLTIGRYPDVPLAQARELANDARKTAALGGTPLAPKVQRAEAQKKLRPTPTSSRSITTPS